MRDVSAQVSLYPLRREDLRTPIHRAWEIFRSHGLKMETGSMSTVLWGEAGDLFAALQEAFEEAGSQGDVVMVVTFSNACPATGKNEL